MPCRKSGQRAYLFGVACIGYNQVVYVHKAQTLSKTDTTVLNSESFDFTYLAMVSYIGVIYGKAIQ